MGFNFDVNDIETKENDFQPLPDGKYCAVLSSIEDEARESKSGNSYEQVKLTFKVVDGNHEGRLVFKNCIYAHPNEMASQIGQQALKSLFVAQGNPAPRMTVESLGECKTCVELVLKTKPSKDPQYGDRQEVYINKCKTPVDPPTSQPPESDGGDIW